MKNPLVSIVIPVYNAEAYVGATIESLLQQDYQPLEIIAVDDGSVDQSAALMERYQPKIRVISQSNQGQSAALRRGWGEARGEVLGYLGADDLLDKNCVARLVTALIGQTQAAGVYPDYRLINEKGERIKDVRAPEFVLREVVEELVCPPGPGLLFWRSAYEKAGPWRDGLRQMPDFDFLLRLGLVGEVLHLKEVLASFRVHAGSQSFAPSSAAKADEPTKVIEDFFSLSGLPDAVKAMKRKSISHAHVISARLHGRSGRWRVAMEHLVRAVRIQPGIALSWRLWRLMVSALFGRFYYRFVKGVGS